jgi:hypothetical protein
LESPAVATRVLSNSVRSSSVSSAFFSPFLAAFVVVRFELVVLCIRVVGEEEKEVSVGSVDFLGAVREDGLECFGLGVVD